MTSFKRLCALLIVAGLIGAGCGSSGGGAKATSDSSSSDRASSDSASSDGRSPKELAADKKKAQDSLLVLSDLPPGWTSQPATSSSSDSPEQKAATKKFTDCIGVDASVLDDDVSNDEAKAKSDKFSQGKDLDFDMRASVGESSDKQQTVLDTFQKPEVTGCFGDFFTEAITFSIEHPASGQPLPAGVTIGDVKVEKIDLKLDADSVTYRATIPVKLQSISLSVVADFVLALVDRTGLTLSFESNGKPFPEDQELEIANKAIAKAKAA